MVAFVRFIMRDNGLAIHINAEHVNQVRQTAEGEPAIYIAGRDTPMLVEGTLEAAIAKLEGVADEAGLLESARESMAERSNAQELELTAGATEPPPTTEPEVVVVATKVKATKAKTAPKAKPSKAKSKPIKDQEPEEAEEAPYPTASWFKGAR